jgi:hypothetical protein
MSTRVGPDKSAVEKICQAVGKLTAKFDGLREKLEELERNMRKKALKTAEMSSGDTLNCNEVAVPDVKTHDSKRADGCRDDSIPIEPLFCIGRDVEWEARSYTEG